MNKLFLSLSGLLYAGIPLGTAFALPVRNIYENQAIGIEGAMLTLPVAPGYGMNINVIPTGAVIKKAWLDDPSRLTLSFDGNLCQVGQAAAGDQLLQGSDCANNSGATVVHIKQINPLSFPSVPTDSDGGTLLSLVLEGGANGKQLYQFRLIPVKGQPEFTTLTVRPESERPQPLIFSQPLKLPAPVPATGTTLNSTTPQPNLNPSSAPALSVPNHSNSAPRPVIP